MDPSSQDYTWRSRRSASRQLLSLLQKERFSLGSVRGCAGGNGHFWVPPNAKAAPLELLWHPNQSQSVDPSQGLTPLQPIWMARSWEVQNLPNNWTSGFPATPDDATRTCLPSELGPCSLLRRDIASPRSGWRLECPQTARAVRAGHLAACECLGCLSQLLARPWGPDSGIEPCRGISCWLTGSSSWSEVRIDSIGLRFGCLHFWVLYFSWLQRVAVPQTCTFCWIVSELSSSRSQSHSEG